MFCDRFHHLLLHESWTAHATKHRLDLPISHTMAISLNYDSLFMIFRFKISLKSFLPVWVIFCSAFFKSFVSWIDRSWWSSRFSYKKEPFTINKKKSENSSYRMFKDILPRICKVFRVYEMNEKYKIEQKHLKNNKCVILYSIMQKSML